MGQQYSLEEKERAIQLFQILGHYTWVIAELGYPSRTMLHYWIKEYRRTGKIEVTNKTRRKYTVEQRKHAIEYYLSHGRSIKNTITALGYPGATLLGEWLREALPKEQRKWSCKFNGHAIKYTPEQKAEIVQKYCSGQTPSQISKEYGICPTTVYTWKKDLLGQENFPNMSCNKSMTDAETNNQSVEELISKKEELEAKLLNLQDDIYRLQMQKDILEKATEIIKKDRGINLKNLTNKEKAILIDALRKKYRLKNLLKELEISKSSYCYQASKIQKKDKYEYLRIRIKEIFAENYCSYGYRRIYGLLKRENIFVSEKVVRRIMREEELFVYVSKQKKYSSYKGEISPEVPNLLQRNFHAEELNQKWLTDITEFHIPAGKVYLSSLIDCFDGGATSWSIGTSPDADLVNRMLDNAISTLKDDKRPIVHSDRGCHYRWPGWIDRMNNAGLTRSMSKKGCSLDNSACEGFFGRLKNEMFYGKSWIGVSIDEFVEELDRYIRWYNEKRIKQSLGFLSPLEYRNKMAQCEEIVTLDK